MVLIKLNGDTALGGINIENCDEIDLYTLLHEITHAKIEICKELIEKYDSESTEILKEILEEIKKGLRIELHSRGVEIDISGWENLK